MRRGREGALAVKIRADLADPPDKICTPICGDRQTNMTSRAWSQLMWFMTRTMAWISNFTMQNIVDLKNLHPTLPLNLTII